MTRLRVLLSKIAGLFRKAHLEQQLDEDVRAHLEMLTEENLRKGMDPEEARYAALRQFGNVSSMKEECRETWTIRIIEELIQDVRYGLRQLRRNPGFTAVAIITLALGIGGTTAIFSVVYGGLINPWPYRDSGRLAVVMVHDPNEPRHDSSHLYVSSSQFLNYRDKNRVFDEVLGGYPENTILTGPHRPPDSFQVYRVTHNTFRVLGVPPVIGRTFTAEDAKPGAPPVMVLNYEAWQKKFGSDPNIIGQTVILSHQPTTVIGVMPPRFKWGMGFIPPSGWLPAVFSPGDAHESSVIGRLKRGVTTAQATADFELLAKNLMAAYPKDYESLPRNATLSVKSLTEASVDRESRRTLIILLAGVGLLLLIACVNVAILLLARASGRQHEIAVRSAVGASRNRLVRQFLLESLMLAVGGSILGCLFAWDVVRALQAIVPVGYVAKEAVFELNIPVLLFTVGVAFVSAVVSGLAPALHAIGNDLQGPLSANSRTMRDSRRQNRLRNLLVVSEVILSLVLLTGGGILFHSFWELGHMDLGYDINDVQMASSYLSQDQSKTAEQRNQFFLETLRRLRALPGVDSAAVAFPSMNWEATGQVEIGGQSGPEDQNAWVRLVGDEFFRTLGIRLFQGRTISEEDVIHAHQVVVVNRAFVNKYFAGNAPLGRQVKVTLPSWISPIKQRGFEIVGVVADTVHAEYTEPTVRPQIFLPFTIAGVPWNLFFIRTAGNPSSLTNSIRKVCSIMNKGLPAYVSPASDAFKGWYTEPRFVAGIVIGFALLGLLLVCIGVYGVLSYAVSERTQEFGIRMALGAQGSDVRRMVLKWGLRWLAIGIGIGIPASIALEKILRNRIWGIKSADPLTMIVVSLVLIGVGLVACYIPARRASKVDPMVALRYE